jgi:lysophospholipase L1-like esterase
MRRAALRASVALVGVVVAACVAELVVRFGLPQPQLIVTPGLTTPDRPGRYRLTPGYEGRYSNRVEYSVRVRVNRYGLRGPELEPSRGAFRLLAVGDSFTFGTGVEENQTFVERAASELRLSGYPAVALNGGTPGFGPPDAVSWVERHGRELDPDVVVLTIFLGNDLQDALLGQGVWRVATSASASGWANGLRTWLDANSHAFILLKRTVPLPLQRSIRAWVARSLSPEERHLDRELEALQRHHPTWMADALTELDQALKRLTASGTPVVAMLIPSDLQLDPSLLRATAAHLGFREELDPDQPRRLFRALLTQRSVPYLDLTELLRRRYNSGERLYYRYDRHWTALAHAIAGRELARFLHDRGLVGTR